MVQSCISLAYLFLQELPKILRAEETSSNSEPGTLCTVWHSFVEKNLYHPNTGF
jgi:hypothetical protein